MSMDYYGDKFGVFALCGRCRRCSLAIEECQISFVSSSMPARHRFFGFCFIRFAFGEDLLPCRRGGRCQKMANFTKMRFRVRLRSSGDKEEEEMMWCSK